MDGRLNGLELKSVMWLFCRSALIDARVIFLNNMNFEFEIDRPLAAEKFNVSLCETRLDAYRIYISRNK